MVENNSRENLLEKAHDRELAKHEAEKVDIIVPTLLYLVATSGMSISGIFIAIYYLQFRSYLWGLLLIAVISAFYWFNHHIIAKALIEKNETSYGKLIQKIWGGQGKRGLAFELAMFVHNILIIAYLQQGIAYNSFASLNGFGTVFGPYATYSVTDAFYYVSIANIPLILLALQNDYKNVRWYGIIGILVWIYVFIGKLTESLATDTPLNNSFNLFSDPNLWILTSTGVIAYFLSSFQIIPYLVENTRKDEKAIKDVINIGSLGSIIILFTVISYYALSTDPNVNALRFAGFAIIGASVTIINVLPTRVLIVQILDRDAEKSEETRDRFITVAILTTTLFLSIFYVNQKSWQVFVGIGALLTSFLAFVFPALVNYEIEKNNNKRILVLVGNSLFAAIVYVAGIFIFLIDEVSY